MQYAVTRFENCGSDKKQSGQMNQVAEKVASPPLRDGPEIASGARVKTQINSVQNACRPGRIGGSEWGGYAASRRKTERLVIVLMAFFAAVFPFLGRLPCRTVLYRAFSREYSVVIW